MTNQNGSVAPSNALPRAAGTSKTQTMPQANHVATAADAHAEVGSTGPLAVVGRVHSAAARLRGNFWADVTYGVSGATSITELQKQTVSTMLRAQSLMGCDALREAAMP